MYFFRFLAIPKTRGFTLIELLVVIALIGILAAVVLTNLSVSRERSENTTVLTQVYEYEKAFQLYFTETGSYPGTYDNAPGPGNRTGIVCLGDAAPSTCLNSTTGVYVQSGGNPLVLEALRNTIRPYMPSQPHISQAKGGQNFSSPAYSGCADFVNPDEPANTTTMQCNGNNYSLWFVLKGTNEDCGRATVARANFAGVYTLCRLQG